ncbi:MAG TPA: ABC transporter ATP-binding protein [Candidatus Acidoferrales bacterium]|jgi:NitT/TauT family transport system ATP-binding protein|nr:ABC transporter ATP-binding protein [Candidatus Acidoferrales bacterium]
MAKLEISSVDVEYYVARSRQTLVALSDVSFEVADGEFVSIVGPSGCGKTTLLNAVDGMLPIKRGRIAVNGRKAMVFQSPSLLPWRTVADNVVYGLELQGKRHAPETKAKVAELIALVGLTGFERSYPAELSGGMQQRVNLARALAVDPELLLLDEPFAALDAQTRELMQAELLRIWQRTRKTAIFITHQIDEAIYLSDRVLVFGARPGTVRASIRIDLPRPRELRIKRQPQFLEYYDRVADLLVA